MLKRPKKKVLLVIGAGLGSLVAVGGVAAIAWHHIQQQADVPRSFIGTPQLGSVRVKDINSLKALAPAQRKEKLEAIAQKPQESPERNRARYLLANELLQQGQAKKALESLNGLEAEYPTLAAYVVSKRAQAYEQLGDTAKAQTTWQEVVTRYPQSSVAADALATLSRNQPQYGDQAIAQFPAHPRTVEIVQQRLKQNPHQPQLLLLLARHGLYLSNYTDILDYLVKTYDNQLKPQDWEAIAFGYWEKQEYGKAGTAYARSPYTSRNAYRIARGLQLGEKPGATAAYQRLVQDFPRTQETAQALIRLSRLVEPTQAMAYLDTAIARFPDRAGQALLEKAKVLEAENNRPAAAEVRQMLLTHYTNSEAAAELRWTLAQERATEKDFQNASVWAQSILTHNPDSDFAPEAGFWRGKWAAQMSRQQEAKSAYEQVLTRYPDSYYAWRSASMLGWNVGDFASVRELKPAVARPANRPQLPSGSDALRELYQMGQDQDAWTLWQVEFQNKMQPTVTEQFTDGVIRLGVGDYLDGIFMVSFLSQRDRPDEQQQYRHLKQRIGYWQALYPCLYLEPIETWSRERQLNPLLVTALIRQESRFMSGIKSSVGATGLMQVMPDTGAWVAKKIKLKEYKLDDPNDNIKLGTWYLDYTHREYNDNSMLAVASYNAGPGAVAGWVTKKGLGDPDLFVETIPYEETRGYVKSVFANYWNYLRLYNPEISQKLAQVSDQHLATSPEDG